ncbi:MAG: class I SAM-dependent RNA methyltransferase, partial [Anaerolineaceae bacterium]|nr:class I SAM-dependent RNA methyltransferase [Anaerolineaceae bacterium]
AILAHYGIPTERSNVKVVNEKRGYANGEIQETLEPSKDRITPRCAHFGMCGGCQYQHLPYTIQLQVKESVFSDQLKRVGGIENPPVLPIVPSPEEWNYRNNVQFHLTRDGKLGYQKTASHEIIPITECPILSQPLNDLWPNLSIEPFPGLERIQIRAGSLDEQLVILETAADALPEMELDIPVSVVQMDPNGTVVLAGENGNLFQILGREFDVSAGAFFQVNTAQAENMVNHVMQLISPVENGTLLDVYCGVGLFTAFLAPHFTRVLGVEASEAACDNFAMNLNEFEHVELYMGPAEVVLPALQVPVDVVLVDPPRSGVDREALQAILALEPTSLIYVSCDPATLARDAKSILAAGYRYIQATPFDMFPQTGHVESISLFQK